MEDTPESPPAWPPFPHSAEQEILPRLEMVENQLVHPPDNRKPIRETKVLEAMRLVPRHVFVPEEARSLAYSDKALPIAHDQTISQPYIVALMTELLALSPESKVLEVGSGSGYQAAILAHLTPHVYSIEIVPALYESARRALLNEGYETVNLTCGDGYLGWEENAPFDAIIVTCAEQNIPQPLWDQLAPKGRMIIPVEEKSGEQKLILLQKDLKGERRTKTIIPVRFVPMTHYT